MKQFVPVPRICTSWRSAHSKGSDPTNLSTSIGDCAWYPLVSNPREPRAARSPGPAQPAGGCKWVISPAPRRGYARHRQRYTRDASPCTLKPFNLIPTEPHPIYEKRKTGFLSIGRLFLYKFTLEKEKNSCKLLKRKPGKAYSYMRQHRR